MHHVHWTCGESSDCFSSAFILAVPMPCLPALLLPTPVHGRHSSAGARRADKPLLPRSLCPPPPSSGNTDNEAREPAMGPQLFCSQGAGWNQAPLGWSQEVPVTRVILLAATLPQTPPSWQPLLHSDLLFPISLPFRYHQMGAVGTFLSVIIFLSGDFSVPEACAGRLPLEPPEKGGGRGGWGSGLLHRTELVLLLTSSSVDA